MRLRITLAASITAALLPVSGQAKADDKSTPEKPNVLVILLDDVGFGQLSPFGGPYRVPNIERVANKGLRYTNFHTTALCSPTRAALLTGRNHHSVGMATITETASDAPGYNGKIPKSAGTLAAILKQAGYSTYALGKWHLTPQPDSGPQGPFDHWPTSMGFDHWYGFQGADTNNWMPELWQDTKAIPTPQGGKYHLTVAMADRAVKFLDKQATSDKPFFLYFAPGAGHAPHHAPKAWIERNKGRFDAGWDVAREQIFATQKQLGIIPQDAVLPPRNEQIAAWDSLDEPHKKLYARMQEVHAGFIEHTDHEIGRVLDALEKSGKLENTIIVVTADNGTSGEGGLDGSINEFRLVAHDEPTFEELHAAYDELGGPKYYNHYPAGWAQAGNTPFRYWKQQSHEGGVRDPMILSWPAQIPDAGGIRAQFSHAIDVVPTILEAAKIEAPSAINSVQQMPIEGTSFLSTTLSADAPTTKKVQYFEMLGNRGVWQEGWKAVVFHGRYPWMQGLMNLRPFDDDVWQLYNLNDDPTESNDLAAANPERLRQMKALFDQEAKAHQVYPLDGSSLTERINGLFQIVQAGVTKFTFKKVQQRIPQTQQPLLSRRDYTLTANVRIPENGAKGAIVASGGRFGGISLYVKDKKINYAINYVGKEVATVTSDVMLPSGDVTIKVMSEYQPQGELWTRSHVKLMINDQLVGEKTIDHAIPGFFGFAESMEIGSDASTPVDDAAYASPAKFTGDVSLVEFEVGPMQNSGTAPFVVGD